LYDGACGRERKVGRITPSSQTTRGGGLTLRGFDLILYIVRIAERERNPRGEGVMQRGRKRQEEAETKKEKEETS